MSFKEQLQKLKENWLLLVIGLIVLFILFSVVGGRGLGINKSLSQMDAYDYDGSYNYNERYSPPSPGGSLDKSGDFSPEVEVRKIIKNSNLRLEVKIGEFNEVNLKVKSIANTSNSYILSENITTRKSGSKDIYTANYTIKVESTKLEDMVNQLKDLGRLTSLNQGANDITGSYTKTEVEIEVEKERLKRYQELYDSTNEDGKLKLIDKIFNQERRIKYLEDSLKNMDQKVDYSTISLTVTEKHNYANIVLVKFSDLIRTLVNSLNSVLKIIFGVIPYAVFAYLIYLFTRLFKRRKRDDMSIKKR